MPNPNYVKEAGTWESAAECHVKNGGSWIEADEVHKRVGGSWVKFYDKHSAPTTKIQVRIINFDENDECSCSLGATEIWEDDMNVGGYAHEFDESSIGQVLQDSDGEVCAEVTAINVTGSADRLTSETYDDCAECNESLMLCESGGEGGE